MTLGGLNGSCRGGTHDRRSQQVTQAKGKDMRLLSRHFVMETVLCVAAFAAQSLFAAQSEPVSNYPSKPVRLILPFVPGAGSDMTGRTIAAKLSEMWGQQVVADNRTGAAGSIGVDLAAHAAPDGYTVCLISASHTVDAAVNPRLPYDLTKDLQGVSQVSSLFYTLYVNPNVPVKTTQELIAYAKANPGKLNFGSSGTGGLQHFAGEMINYLGGVKMVHIPYKGGAAAILASVSGEVQVGFLSLLGVRPYMANNRVRVLGITAAKRSPAAPDLPTLAEGGLPGYEVDQWYGIIASAKIPLPIVDKLSAKIAEALKSPDVIQRLTADGSMPVGSTAQQFSAHIKSEIAKWRKLAKEANLMLQ
jgi:tripartite-type tricarboxylate transporter receptor subunit TctC